MIYNIHYDICAVVISLFTIYYMFAEKGFKKNANKFFLGMVLCELISSFLDIFSSIVNSRIGQYSYFVRDFSNYLFLGVHNVTPFIFVLYILYLLGIDKRMKKRHFFFLSIPLVVTLTALALNPVFRWVFYYDTDGIYSHGLLFAVLYVDAFLYMLLAIELIARFHGALPKSKSYPLLLFIALSLIPILVQMYIPHILIELFFQALGILGVMLSIENEDEVINHITGLYNRYLFMNDVGTAVKSGNNLHILTIKLPITSYYNANLGVQYMNSMMRQMALWLSGLNGEIFCYDCEGGNFALVSYTCSEEKMWDLAQQVRKRFEDAWYYKNLGMVFPAQICILKMPAEICTIEQLLMIIDAPFADQQSESQIVDSNEFDSYRRNMLIEQKMKEALKKHTFQVWYQPIWDREKGKIHSAEALLRLIDDELGFISPEEFIPVAEKNGLIIELGEYVLEEVCRFYVDNNLGELGIEFIEVNLSLVQCANRKLAGSIDKIMKKYGISPDKINLEITESAAANNQFAIKDTVMELSKRGFSLSLDDYGTGYSNFSHMFEMPFSIIKLDKSILWSAMDPKNSSGSKNARLLLESTIMMMQKMNYYIVVEGVETEVQKQLLEKLGCDYLQGYYFAKPLPAKSFLEYVERFNLAQ